MLVDGNKSAVAAADEQWAASLEEADVESERSKAVVAAGAADADVGVEHSQHGAWEEEEGTGLDVCWAILAGEEHAHSPHCLVQEVAEDKKDKCYCTEQTLADSSMASSVLVVRYNEMAFELVEDSNSKAERGVQMLRTETVLWQ